MRIFKSKKFAKIARKERIADTKLCEAIDAAEQGNIDADYGGGVIKQRIAREGGGKSGGYRAIILFRRGELSFFVHSFAKSDQANISDTEERNFKALAEVLLASTDEDLNNLVQADEFSEVTCHEQE